MYIEKIGRQNSESMIYMDERLDEPLYIIKAFGNFLPSVYLPQNSCHPVGSNNYLETSALNYIGASAGPLLTLFILALKTTNLPRYQRYVLFISLAKGNNSVQPDS